LNEPAQLWADPRLVYPVAVIAVTLLLASLYLFRRRRREGRQAGLICLVLSIALHACLILLVPYLKPFGGGWHEPSVPDHSVGIEGISFSTFDPEMNLADLAGAQETPSMAPLPVSDLASLTQPSLPNPAEVPLAAQELDDAPEQASQPRTIESLHWPKSDPFDQLAADLDSVMDAWLDQAKPAPQPDRPLATAETHSPTSTSSPAAVPAEPTASAMVTAPAIVTPAAASQGRVLGDLKADFASRVGAAKQQALLSTGGTAETELAVAAALKFLADAQRSDGAWDPIASGAGQERATLGTNRGGAGSRAETAITGLALLSLMGAGNTHAEGEYADHVYRGLSYLIRVQKPDGSLAGNATVYAANYCHGMAALAMCEAAAITGDASAIEASRRAMAHTIRMQHPVTGGWRYTAGDPGDLSQAGWQVMVLDAGHRAGIPLEQTAVFGVQRFLRSVRSGRGGLAGYRPGEAASRTMTAEALATRLLIGEQIPASEIAEAESYLLQQLPGVGQDNYYYWYYATLALHQLQDDAWSRWNQALQHRLLATQRADGSWPTTSMWGGYGGSIYTTSMATLCLESYYRHALRDNLARLADAGRNVSVSR